MTAGLTKDEDSFYEDFTTGFFSVDGVLKVSEADRQDALRLAKQANKAAALEAMASFANTDFRDDLTKVTVPTLVIHGDGDATVPYEGSGARTHAAVAGLRAARDRGRAARRQRQRRRRVQPRRAGVPRQVRPSATPPPGGAVPVLATGTAPPARPVRPVERPHPSFGGEGHGRVTKWIGTELFRPRWRTLYIPTGTNRQGASP